MCIEASDMHMHIYPAYMACSRYAYSAKVPSAAGQSAVLLFIQPRSLYIALLFVCIAGCICNQIYAAYYAALYTDVVQAAEVAKRWQNMDRASFNSVLGVNAIIWPTGPS